ncbi:MAG TPA: hypothetical protein VMW50_06735, partial [Dehalococcoidia bacterium]|nr:hypothetical protein [Dehalococcoidia bacterium]
RRCARRKERIRAEGEDTPARAMWVSGMSEASAANPDEGAEPCEATEELQLDVSCTYKLRFYLRRAVGRRPGADTRSQATAIINLLS